MTSRPDRSLRKILCALSMLALAACSDTASEADPLARAQAALARGDGITAEVELRGMLEAGTPPAEVAAYMGEAELAQGSLAEAREWLGGQKFSDATLAHGNHMLGRLEMAEGNLPEAGRAYDRSLNAGGDEPELWVDIGRLRYRGGEQAQAIEASQKAVDLGPENPQALRFRGQLVRDAKGMAAALPYYEQALELNPKDPELLADYAALLGELGRGRDMLKTIRLLTKVDPGNRRAYYLQAVLAARAHKYDLALTLLQRSGEVDREVPSAMLLSAIIDMERGNYASAAQMLDRLSTIQPDNRRVEPLLARALALGHNDKELVYRFEAAAQRPAASPYLQSLVARSLEAMGERERAAKLLVGAASPAQRQFAAIDSKTPLEVAAARSASGGSELLALIRSAIAARRNPAAVAAAQSFAERFPGSGDARALLADTRLASRQLAQSQKAFSEAADIRRSWPIAFKLATVMAAQGKTEDANSLLMDFMNGEPGNMEAMTVLSLRFAEAGMWSESAKFADLAFTHGGARDPVLLSLRAKAAFELGDLDLAVTLAEAAHDLQPMSLVAAKTLADAYRAANVDPALLAVAETKVRLLRAG
ncbi:MAG: tetratricopeptide repeat protein [Sphingomonadaceae bacterium]|nr:tetratricopeptide repeat protein [Sphingomonadaceae bacterium]MCP5385036.1 tetratricopeptide repeat protein [Altererythrobacter sp.]MCP5391535.1 tetratricopeptide repeat protein [Sphingomonadaceae bacterium]MCP5394891.1 tetratricopeptide repeat protein [Sphingomonadaceae bacterium]